MDSAKRVNWARIFLAITFVLTVGALVRFAQQAMAEGVFLVTRGRTAIMAAGVLAAFTELGLLVANWIKPRDRLLAVLTAAQSALQRLGKLNWLLALAVLVAYPYLIRSYYGRYLTSEFPRYLAFWLATALLAAVFSVITKWKHWAGAWAAAGLALGLAYYFSGYANDVSTYPLSLGWSEASRYYYASTFFANQLYGIENIQLPVTHPSRYVMQSVPFLIPATPLWAHRVWQVLMSAGFTLGAALLLARRLRLERRETALFVMWGALFLFQAPLFYQMLVCVVLLFWGYDGENLWKTTLIVLLASAWAGITRINWVPMPAILATTFYVLETRYPVDAKGLKALWSYFWRPALWFTIGMAAGLATQTWYALASRNPPDVFASSFTSDLLWNRLFPSSTYSLGILTGILLVSLPLLAYLVLGLRSQRGRHSLRLLALGVILFVFFAGGLAVSVKIGGGTNLHNMDAYLVLLLAMTAALYYGKFMQEDGKSDPYLPAAPLLALIILVPIFFSINSGGPRPVYDYPAAQQQIAIIQEYVEQAEAAGSEVLFLSQRHLITFGLVDGALVPEYEKVFVMEMAMAGNQDYLNRFEQDLRDQRFAFIISDPLFRKIKEPGTEPLAEENNAWVRQVTGRILCGYEVVKTFADIQILAPLPQWECD